MKSIPNLSSQWLFLQVEGLNLQNENAKRDDSHDLQR